MLTRSDNKIVVAVLALGLWLATAVVGLWEMTVVYDMVWRIMARVGSDSGQTYWTSVSLSQWAVIIMAIVWIGAVIGSAEYHYRHLGKPSSWRLFGWMIVAEVVILVAVLLV